MSVYIAKKIYQRTIIAIFCIKTLCVGHLVAQEIHFSQFYENPLTANPANTAWYDGNLRLNGMYRTQWKAVDNKPYQTISLSAEKQFQFYDHSYGFGVLFLRDESGYHNLINDKFLASGAFALDVNGHKLSGGVQFGLVYKTTRNLHYTYDEQFDLGGEDVFNRSFDNGETEGGKIFHMVVNAGVLWQKRLADNFVALAGFSLFNINVPNESIYGMDLDGTRQLLRSVVQLGGKSEFGRVAVIPRAYFVRQEKSTDFLLGANVEYSVKKKISPYVGTLFRYGFSENYDASIWIIGAKMNRFDVGISYDINVSSLRDATKKRGAFEVSLTYLTPSWKSSKVKIPCERI